MTAQFFQFAFKSRLNKVHVLIRKGGEQIEVRLMHGQGYVPSLDNIVMNDIVGFVGRPKWCKKVYLRKHPQASYTSWLFDATEIDGE